MTAAAKHTAGPWHLELAPYGFDIFSEFFADRPPQWIGHVHTSIGPSSSERERLGMYPDRDTCEANARLIAAAPEMLEALKLASDALGANRARDVVDAAIAKATEGTA